ncbi:MAG TPA: sulfatase [bacterium]|nr:sulfatase [bacterium]
MTTPVASPADPAPPAVAPIPPAAVSPTAVTLPWWAPAIPWFILWLVELPYAVWLWGFSLSKVGPLGHPLALAAYLGIGVLWGLLGWIAAPLIVGVRRTRTHRPALEWHLIWAAIGAWGILGVGTALDFLLFRDGAATPFTGLAATLLGALVGLSVGRGLVRSLIHPPKGDVANPSRPGRTLLVLALFAALFSAGKIAGNISPPRPGDPKPPNVLLVTLDTVNIARVSAYGYHLRTTPTLERLAREGVSFTQAYAHVPLTGPSHATIFTGLQPQAFEVYENARPMPYGVATLAETFRGHGFFTAGIPATKMMRELHHFHQGFDRYPERSAENGIKSLPWTRLLPCRYIKQVWGRSVDFSHLIDDAKYSNRHALESVAYAAHRPWFMWVHYYDPHAPYHAPPEHYQQQLDTPGFDAATLGSVDGLFDLSYTALSPLLGACFLKQQGVSPLVASPTEIEDLRRTYDAQLHYTDTYLGKLLDELKSSGQLENTLVVVTADHGEALYDRGYFGHNYFLHQDEVHVPLIFWWPGKIAPKTIDLPVGLVDLAPTIRTLAGLPHPTPWTTTRTEWKGRDRAAWLTGQPPAEAEPVYLQQFSFSRAVVTPTKEKLIFQAVQGDTQHAANPWTGDKWLRYDLSRDPQGLYDLDIDPQPDAIIERRESRETAFRELTRLQGILDAEARDVEGTGVNDINYAGYLGLALSKAELEALRSLGYFQGNSAALEENQAECRQEPEYTAAAKTYREVAVP